ncbi:MAG: hypothetical protein MJ232_04925 [archaeon]|nr:hypothetical protein [archaeon]
MVTNTIRDEVEYSNTDGWSETPISNEKICEELLKQEKEGFLAFSWGCWVTAYARNNLLKNLLSLDDYVIYADTDSLKIAPGYDQSVIERYNQFVEKKIKHVSDVLQIPLDRFAPEDIKGKARMLGLFDSETAPWNEHTYSEYITQGAKKYAYKEINEQGEEEVHITVSGVPKSGAKALHGDLHNFKDNLVFRYEDTGKNSLFYCDGQEPVSLVDEYGNELIVDDSSGCCIVPNTYTLSKSLEYAELLDDSSNRAIYKKL